MTVRPFHHRVYFLYGFSCDFWTTRNCASESESVPSYLHDLFALYLCACVVCIENNSQIPGLGNNDLYSGLIQIISTIKIDRDNNKRHIYIHLSLYAVCRSLFSSIEHSAELECVIRSTMCGVVNVRWPFAGWFVHLAVVSQSSLAVQHSLWSSIRVCLVDYGRLWSTVPCVGTNMTETFFHGHYLTYILNNILSLCGC